MALEVIGAGLGRTGTLSLKEALEELGFAKCYHMTEVLPRPDHIRAWDAASRGEAVDWEQLFEGYRATVDWPACSFYRELMARYPDARVILSVRDPDRWYDSARATIYTVRHSFPGWVPLVLPRIRRLFRMLDRIVWVGMFGGRFDDRAHAIAVFNAFNDEVKRTVPADRLLVFEAREGWGPLCGFLGVPVPEGKPFPHVNDAEQFRARIEKVTRNARRVGLAILAALVIASAALGWVAIRSLG